MKHISVLAILTSIFLASRPLLAADRISRQNMASPGIQVGHAWAAAIRTASDTRTLNSTVMHSILSAVSAYDMSRPEIAADLAPVREAFGELARNFVDLPRDGNGARAELLYTVLQHPVVLKSFDAEQLGRVNSASEAYRAALDEEKAKAVASRIYEISGRLGRSAYIDGVTGEFSPTSAVNTE